MTKKSVLNILPFLPPSDREQINRVRIAEAMLKLAARDRAILRLRFGLDGKEPMTQAGIAEALGITQQAVSWRLRRFMKTPLTQN